MKHLFSPFRIRNLELQNRIVMPALASFLFEDDGSITDRTVEHYRLRAAGGPGMVIVEACAVSPEGAVSPHQARIDDDRFTEGLARIARAMKAEGTVPAVQLHHGGRQTSVKIIRRKPVAPSPLPCPTIHGEVEPLTVEGIQELIRRFEVAAIRAREAGFELIEIHGAHGYLVNQFLSRFSNIREDEYGGDVRGRTRFAREIVESLRRRLGGEFPLSFKISAEEFVPNGLSVAESIEILKILVEAGVDVVQISAGNDATPEWISQPMFMPKACLAGYAGEVRRALRIPVMAVGRINEPELAENIIATGQADLVCMGRGLLADPEMPKKASEGRLDEVRHCLACNTCMESIFKRGRIECLVNPALGREKEMVFRPAVKRKKIMVVGGGPGGLNVAWVAARRGHEVHLFERNDFLGGQLVFGTATRFKAEMRSLIEFQKRQIAKYGVTCHLNTEVTADTVQRENPDAVILATGSYPFPPPVEGIDRDHVLPFTAVLNGRRPLLEPTAVIGGGPTGCEVALHLAEHGCPVTIIELLPSIGARLESMTRKVMLSKLRQHGVEMLTGCRVSRIEESGVVVATDEGIERFVEAAKIVVATGTKSDNKLYEQVRSLGYETHQIGDCLEPRSAKAAIYEGAVLGRAI